MIPSENIHKSHNPKGEVKSPCKNVCTLDHKGKCVGCFRTIEEIANWSLYPDADKRKVLNLTQLRMQLPEYFD